MSETKSSPGRPRTWVAPLVVSHAVAAFLGAVAFQQIYLEFDFPWLMRIGGFVAWPVVAFVAVRTAMARDCVLEWTAALAASAIVSTSLFVLGGYVEHLEITDDVPSLAIGNLLMGALICLPGAVVYRAVSRDASGRPRLTIASSLGLTAAVAVCAMVARVAPDYGYLNGELFFFGAPLTVVAWLTVWARTPTRTSPLAIVLLAACFFGFTAFTVALNPQTGFYLGAGLVTFVPTIWGLLGWWDRNFGDADSTHECSGTDVAVAQGKDLHGEQSRSLV